MKPFRMGLGLCVNLIFAVLTTTAPSFAAGEWDGNWGSPSTVMIKIKGSSVEYFARGMQVPVRDVSMNASQISFQVGNGRAWMTMNLDRSAVLQTQFNGRMRSGSIFRGSNHN